MQCPEKLSLTDWLTKNINMMWTEVTSRFCCQWASIYKAYHWIISRQVFLLVSVSVECKRDQEQPRKLEELTIQLCHVHVYIINWCHSRTFSHCHDMSCKTWASFNGVVCQVKKLYWQPPPLPPPPLLTDYRPKIAVQNVQERNCCTYERGMGESPLRFV